MLEGVQVNYLAVLVSAVAYMALGAIWYSPALFGKGWMKGIGKTEEQIKADSKPINYLFAIIFAFVAAYGIARIMEWMNAASIGIGIKTGLLVSVCFVLATFFMNDSFEARPTSLTFINVLYHVVGLIICGVILGAWMG